MTVCDSSRFSEKVLWLRHLPKIRREEHVFLYRRAINTFAYVTIKSPIDSPTVKVRPDLLVSAAYPLVSDLQTGE